MKILYIVNDIDFFISHRLSLAKCAIEKNYEVFVASNALPKTKIQGITFLRFKINRSSVRLSSNLNSLIQLNKLIKKVSPDLVHSVTLKSILLSNLCLIFNRKVKKINAVAGLGYLFTSKRKSPAAIIIKGLFKFINIINKPYYIFQNENDLNEFKKLGVKENYNLIKGSGVDHNEFKYTPPIKNEKVVLTFTGRILWEKGLVDLINAVNFLPDEIQSKVVLNIYGKIDLDNPTHISEEQIIKFLKPNLIIWHGFSNDIKNILIQTDIYCLPSYYGEGLPKSILEAMAIGRPIITSNSPGCEDTVQEGVNGFKVNIKEYKTLSEKLQFLIENERLRLEMGKKSREIFEENFTLDIVTQKTFELYNAMTFVS